MIPEKDKRYLLRYKFNGIDYVDIGTYTGKEFADSEQVEYVFKVEEGSILMSNNEIIKCVDNNSYDEQIHYLKTELIYYKNIIAKILREFPIGSQPGVISPQTINNLPEQISYYISETERLKQKVEALRRMDKEYIDTYYKLQGYSDLTGWHDIDSGFPNNRCASHDVAKRVLSLLQQSYRSAHKITYRIIECAVRIIEQDTVNGTGSDYAV